jgi:Tfp pilus assembly protein PilO
MTRAQKWTAATAALVLVLLAAGWLLLVSPKRSEAAELAERRASQEQAISMLETQIRRLMEQSDELPAKRLLLEEIRRQIPADPALPRLLRDLSRVAGSAGVELVSLEPGAPESMLPASPADPAASGAGVTAGSGADGLVSIPVTISATGKFFTMQQFIDELEELERVLLVTGFVLTNPEADSGGTELTLALTGLVFATTPGTDDDTSAGADSTSTGSPAAGAPADTTVH